MMSHSNRSGRAVSMPNGLLSGAVMNLLITLTASIFLSKMIDSGILTWDQVGYGVMATLLIASFSGAWLSCHRIKHRRLMVCGLSALLYSLLLLATSAMFYGGQYEGIPVSLLLIFTGSMVAFLLTAPKSRSPRRKKYRTVAR